MKYIILTSLSPYPLQSFGQWFGHRFACWQWTNAPSSWRCSLSECQPPRSACRSCGGHSAKLAEFESHTPSPRLWYGLVVCPCSSYRGISYNPSCSPPWCKAKVSAPLSGVVGLGSRLLSFVGETSATTPLIVRKEVFLIKSNHIAIGDPRITREKKEIASGRQLHFIRFKS